MNRLDIEKQARAKFAYANKMATMLMTKYQVGSPECNQAIIEKWQPIWDDAVAYARANNLSKYDVA